MPAAVRLYHLFNVIDIVKNFTNYPAKKQPTSILGQLNTNILKESTIFIADSDGNTFSRLSGE